VSAPRIKSEKQIEDIYPIVLTDDGQDATLKKEGATRRKE
jgi:hypothetical protein